ncbi:ABC transporter substrate-binding protein [Pseudidiomarina gelatinasegens]|uniref:MlaC/ttg2D family ABC transporter substrate-binding protein n=1 Tax=Pseudidiomarina gelatinasegens TaxID=2487740 RepID=UPI0030EED775
MKMWLVAAFAAVVGFGGIVPAQAELIRDENPYILLEKLANETLERIEQDRELIDQDINHIRLVIREEMMPYVDYVYAAKRVLGRNLSETTEEQRQEFYTVFRDYLITTYAGAFTQYDEEKHIIEFGNAERFEKGSRMVVVNTRLVEQGRPPIRLDFKMRFDTNDNVWKAYDLVVEGVSLLNSKQAEISSVIRSSGIDGTIALLREKAQETVQTRDLSEGAE